MAVEILKMHLILALLKFQFHFLYIYIFRAKKRLVGTYLPRSYLVFFSILYFLKYVYGRSKRMVPFDWGAFRRGRLSSPSWQRRARPSSWSGSALFLHLPLFSCCCCTCRLSLLFPSDLLLPTTQQHFPFFCFSFVCVCVCVFLGPLVYLLLSFLFLFPFCCRREGLTRFVSAFLSYSFHFLFVCVCVFSFFLFSHRFFI